MTFQFTVCQKVNDEWVEIPNVKTPTVTAETMQDAYTHPFIEAYFKQYPDYRIHRRV